MMGKFEDDMDFISIVWMKPLIYMMSIYLSVKFKYNLFV